MDIWLGSGEPVHGSAVPRTARLPIAHIYAGTVEIDDDQIVRAKLPPRLQASA